MTPSDTVERYFRALGERNVDAAAACFAPGAVDRLVGQRELSAPEGVRSYFQEFFAAFPDLSLEVLETAAADDRVTVRWKASGTFAGPFQGFTPNGSWIEIEGCDVVRVEDDKIKRIDAYIDSGDIARQLGFLPAAESPAEARLTRLANLGTRLRSRTQGGPPERIAEGVWIVRGGFPARAMNVYLIEDEGGVTAFDAGIEDMAPAIRTAGARLGGIKRVVLGHADADHRGAAPGLHAPVYCHPAERDAAESPNHFRSYWRWDKLEPPARWVVPRLVPVWDGGAVQIAGTVSEGDRIAGFEVFDLPGHAPGLIGLFREQDRLALVSDCFYTIDLRTGMKALARVPHPATNISSEQAADSIRKLAQLEPSAAWPGHADPVTHDVVAELYRAASRH